MLKGYPTTSGYMGYVNGKYILFETDEEYYKYCEENDDLPMRKELSNNEHH